MDYTDDEKRACWYEKEEWRTMRSNVKQTISAMSDDIHHESHITRRGLENRTPDELRRRRQLRLTVCLAVIDEQQRQWENGVTDPSKIAFVSGHLTNSCRIKARTVGVMDAVNAMDGSL